MFALAGALTACGDVAKAPGRSDNDAGEMTSDAGEMTSDAGATTTDAGATDSVRIETHSLSVGSVQVSVPFSNGNGIHLADVPVTVHTENGQLYAVRWTTTPTRVPIDQRVGGMTLAGKGDHLLVVYVSLEGNELRLRESTDGGRTWSSAHSLGARPTGPALPTACVYDANGQRRKALAWSHQPSESEGPLVIAQDDGSGWKLPVTHTSIASSGAALYCADGASPQIVWRDHRYKASGGPVVLYTATIDSAGNLTQSSQIMDRAYDPGFCGYGPYRFVSYHDDIAQAFLARSEDDGASYTPIDVDSTQSGTQPFDDSGKYVSVGCSSELLVATWGDWPTKQEAQTRASTRHLGMALSRDHGHTWVAARPAGDRDNLGPTTISVSGGTAYLLWPAPGELWIAEVSLH
ncbi:MAG: sialidase family protein [Myxococcota bacterium]